MVPEVAMTVTLIGDSRIVALVELLTLGTGEIGLASLLRDEWIRLRPCLDARLPPGAVGSRSLTFDLRPCRSPGTEVAFAVLVFVAALESPDAVGRCCCCCCDAGKPRSLTNSAFLIFLPPSGAAFALLPVLAEPRPLAGSDGPVLSPLAVWGVAGMLGWLSSGESSVSSGASSARSSSAMSSGGVSPPVPPLLVSAVSFCALREGRGEEGRGGDERGGEGGEWRGVEGGEWRGRGKGVRN